MFVCFFKTPTVIFFLSLLLDVSITLYLYITHLSPFGEHAFIIICSFNLHCRPITCMGFYFILKAEAQKGNTPFAIQLVSNATRKMHHTD